MIKRIGKAATELRGQGRSQAPAEGSKLGNEGKTAVQAAMVGKMREQSRY